MQLYGDILYPKNPSLRISEKNPDNPFQKINVIKNDADLNKVIAFITELQDLIEKEEQKIREYFQNKRNKLSNLQ